MKRLILIYLFVILQLCGVCCAGKGMDREQILKTFREGNDCFRKANSCSGGSPEAERLYSRAILCFESIIDSGGIENPMLYYNLANAYFLSGDTGRAILNYRRARQLDPSDANIEKNLAFARSRRIDQIDSEPAGKVMHTLFFWHYDIPLQTRFFIACLLFGVLSLVITLNLWNMRIPGYTAVLVIASVLLLCFAVSAAVELAGISQDAGGVIVAEEVAARQGDGLSYMPSFSEPLHAGTEFRLLEKRPGWYKVVLADGSVTWLPDEAVEII